MESLLLVLNLLTLEEDASNAGPILPFQSQRSARSNKSAEHSLKSRWQETERGRAAKKSQEERVERDTKNEFGRGDAQLPVLNFGVSPELARRLGTAQYQLPGGLHDHPKTGVSRTRCKSLLVPLPWATYGLPLHLVLVRRDQTSSAKPSAPGAFACLSLSACVSLSVCCYPNYTKAPRATRGTRHARR